MELWMKILWAAALVMMLFVLWPRVRDWSKTGPRAGSGDWQAALLPIALVVGFVVILVMMVRG
jgi:hypothetical protein